MNKFKLFLLTWVVSILGIGCFTNAWLFPDSKFVYDYQNLVTNNVNISNLHCDWVWELSFSIWGLNVSNWQYEYLLRTKQCPFSVEGDIQWFRVNWLNNHPVVYTYVSSTPSTQLSPVISWLSDSISEFIPYVVYVGLWVLGAVIWFVSIKWLINRVRRQSFWVFSSRKKK